MKSINMQKSFLAVPTSMLNQGYSSTALLLYGLIYKLSASDFSECFPTNSYIAKMLGVNTRSISRLLNELKEKNAISIRIDSDNKNLRWIKPLITLEVPILMEKEQENDDISKFGGFQVL